MTTNEQVLEYIVAKVLEPTPVASMSDEDAETPAIGPEDFAMFSVELRAIERAFGKSKQAGRAALIAFARSYFAAGYNSGADDERMNITRTIGQLAA